MMKNNNIRHIDKIYQATSQHWVGDAFLVQPLFSHMGEDRGTDPFLMLDYAAPRRFEASSSHIRGVGQHPHKGFETVTVAYQGEVAHKDSTGAGGIIAEGDVQWMTAGAGIIHEEYHSEAFSQAGGVLEMVQLWVNLPAKDKSTPPAYQHLSKEAIPVVNLENNTRYLRLIAGEYQGTQGAARTFTEMNVWDVVVNANEQISLTVPATHNLSMVVLRGEASFNQQESAGAGQLVVFQKTAGDVQIQAGDEALKILLLSGVPIDEPIVGYGPFVMNSREEIIDAINDFNSGRFGQIAH